MSAARFRQVHRRRWATCASAALLALFPFAASTQVVRNTLTDWLRHVFPEMNRGYSNLSGYDTLNRTDDLNHRLPESTLADAE